MRGRLCRSQARPSPPAGSGRRASRRWVYGLLIRQAAVPGAEHLFHFVAVVVAGSTIAHFSTDVLFAAGFDGAIASHLPAEHRPRRIQPDDRKQNGKRPDDHGEDHGITGLDSQQSSQNSADDAHHPRDRGTRAQRSSPPRPCDCEQERALFKCFHVMGHTLIECEQTAGAKNERPL